MIQYVCIQVPKSNGACGDLALSGSWLVVWQLVSSLLLRLACCAYMRHWTATCTVHMVMVLQRVQYILQRVQYIW